MTGVSAIDGGTMENCGMVVPTWGGWTDWSCQIEKVVPIVCACEHPGQMYLQLRGLCPDTNLDRFYVPRNKQRSGALILIGLKTTLIAYDKADLSAMFDSLLPAGQKNAISTNFFCKKIKQKQTILGKSGNSIIGQPVVKNCSHV